MVDLLDGQSFATETFWISILSEDIDQPDCTAVIQKGGCELYICWELYLDLRKYWYDCVYINMLVKYNDLSGVECS